MATLDHGSYDKYAKVGGKDFNLGKPHNSIRQKIIYWKTYQEYHKANISTGQIDEKLFYEEVKKLLNLVPDDDIPSLLEKIYTLPDREHVLQINRECLAYEPVSSAIRKLFMLLKQHYETTITYFIQTQNEKTRVINVLDDLYEEWKTIDKEKALESSSLLLLFMNPPFRTDSVVVLDLDNPKINDFNDKLFDFHYLGFCPKVPLIRLEALLKFPIFELVDAIQSMDATYEPVDYDKLYDAVKDIPAIEPPSKAESSKRSDVPEDLIGINKTIWLVGAILDTRFALLPECEKFIQYYIDTSTKISEISKKFSEIIGKEDKGWESDDESPSSPELSVDENTDVDNILSMSESEDNTPSDVKKKTAKSSKPTSKPRSKPTSKPRSKPTSKPRSKPTSKPTSKPSTLAARRMMGGSDSD